MRFRTYLLLAVCLLTVPLCAQDRERDVRRERERREATERESRSNDSLKRENDKMGRESDRIGKDSDKLTRDNDRMSRDSGKSDTAKNDGTKSETAKSDAAKSDAAKSYDLSSMKNDPERQRRVEQSLRDMDQGKKNYERDGIVFENREKKLPDKPNGYYHEYTVKPPDGVKNRGTERLIKGESGEVWYSRDHYQDQGGYTKLR